MTPEEIEEIARQTAEALHSDPAWWEIVAAFGPVAVLTGAVATLWIGLRSVRQQRINAEQQSRDNGVALDLQRTNAEKQSQQNQDALDLQRVNAERQAAQSQAVLDLQRVNAEKQFEQSQAALAERRRADDRAEWWKRVQWALDAVLSGVARRENLGFKMLDQLTKSGSAGEEDLGLLDPAWLRSAASSQSQAEETLDDTAEYLQSMAAQGLIPDEYLGDVRRIIDEDDGKEHNGSQTDREVHDERNP